MAKRFYCTEAVCPYYHGECSPQEIVCEGVEDGTVLHLAFANKLQMKTFRKENCESYTNNCMIAEMLDRKWNYDRGK